MTPIIRFMRKGSLIGLEIYENGGSEIIMKDDRKLYRPNEVRKEIIKKKKKGRRKKVLKYWTIQLSLSQKILSILPPVTMTLKESHQIELSHAYSETPHKVNGHLQESISPNITI